MSRYILLKLEDGNLQQELSFSAANVDPKVLVPARVPSVIEYCAGEQSCVPST